MVNPTISRDQVVALLESRLIRDLVEIYPGVMPVLADYGMDLCCGGGHTVAEAAQLHGIDFDQIVDALAPAIAQASA